MIPTTGVSLQSGIRTRRGQSSGRVTRQQDRRPAIHSIETSKKALFGTSCSRLTHYLGDVGGLVPGTE
jgi:hypothetical protein